jgi:hypothetical protein
MVRKIIILADDLRTAHMSVYERWRLRQHQVVQAKRDLHSARERGVQHEQAMRGRDPFASGMTPRQEQEFLERAERSYQLQEELIREMEQEAVALSAQLAAMEPDARAAGLLAERVLEFSGVAAEDLVARR